MLLRLLLLFTVLPLVELMLLVELYQRTNWAVTIGLVLLTGFVGAALARRQGWQTAARMRHELSVGRAPTESLLEGIMILLAGAMLIMPGLLTDAFGFLLLAPPLRRRLGAWLVGRFQSKFKGRRDGPGWTELGRSDDDRDEIIDVKVISPPQSETIREPR